MARRKNSEGFVAAVFRPSSARNVPPVASAAADAATKPNRGFSLYAARGVGDGNFVPHCGQLAQPSSTPRPQFGQVGSNEVPQCGQNV